MFLDGRLTKDPDIIMIPIRAGMIICKRARTSTSGCFGNTIRKTDKHRLKRI
jgi:hypothetical protein